MVWQSSGWSAQRRNSPLGHLSLYTYSNPHIPCSICYMCSLQSTYQGTSYCIIEPHSMHGSSSEDNACDVMSCILRALVPLSSPVTSLLFLKCVPYFNFTCSFRACYRSTVSLQSVYTWWIPSYYDTSYWTLHHDNHVTQPNTKTILLFWVV